MGGVNSGNRAATAIASQNTERLMLAVLGIIAFVLSGCSSMSVPYRALYLDLDGTALGSDHSVRPSTLKALAEYRERGGKIGIATGRILEQARVAIEVIRPDLPVVLFNGSVIYNVADSSFSVLDTLDANTVRDSRTMLDEEESIDGYIVHFSSYSVASNESNAMLMFATESDITLSKRPHDSKAPVLKILVVCSPDVAEGVSSMLAKNLGGAGRVVISSPRTVEVLPSLTNKANAIGIALSSAGLRLSDTVAFGDSGNDREMLSEVGLGVAMCNGRPDTQNAADVLVCTNDSDAIAKFIRFLLRCRAVSTSR